MTEAVALGLLWLSGFTSATVLPGNSELALMAYLGRSEAQPWLALAVVTCGNLLGGLTTVLLGRMAPQAPQSPWLQRLQRHGAVLAVLTWLPLIGDVIAAGAGWLRLPLLTVCLWMLLGRGGRYLVVLWISL